MGQGATARQFTRLLRPHWDALYAMARRYVWQEADARDLLQETALKAWRFHRSHPHEDYERAWWMTIMRRIVLDWQRQASRRIRMVPTTHVELTERYATDADEPFADPGAMDERRFREMLDESIVAALDRLEPLYREVILLHVCGGMRYREIGELLDCPIGTVMSRMARARRILREQLQQDTRWNRSNPIPPNKTTKLNNP